MQPKITIGRHSPAFDMVTAMLDLHHRLKRRRTNGAVNGGNLIRVAVTRDINQAPVAGSFVGAPGDYLGMTVDVAVFLERRAEASSA
jgi:hypothetical protein